MVATAAAFDKADGLRYPPLTALALRFRKKAKFLKSVRAASSKKAERSLS
jgi:hypothetical protein